MEVRNFGFSYTFDPIRLYYIKDDDDDISTMFVLATDLQLPHFDVTVQRKDLPNRGGGVLDADSMFDICA